MALFLCQKITLKGPGGSISVWLESLSDFKVFREVFIKKEYAVANATEVHTVIDVGSNVGYSAAFFFLQYPAAHIYALEPVAEAFHRLKSACAQSDRLHPLKIALAHVNGPIQIHTGRELASSSLIERAGMTSVEEVEGVTLSQFLEKQKLQSVDLLKVDAEGAEEFILKDPSIRKASLIVGEIHEDLVGKDASTIVSYLHESGFSIELKRETSKRVLLYASHD